MNVEMRFVKSSGVVDATAINVAAATSCKLDGSINLPKSTLHYSHLGYAQVLADTLHGGNEVVVAHDRQQSEEVDGAQEVQDYGSLLPLFLYKHDQLEYRI